HRGDCLPSERGGVPASRTAGVGATDQSVPAHDLLARRDAPRSDGPSSGETARAALGLVKRRTGASALRDNLGAGVPGAHLLATERAPRLAARQTRREHRRVIAEYLTTLSFAHALAWRLSFCCLAHFVSLLRICHAHARFARGACRVRRFVPRTARRPC